MTLRSLLFILAFAAGNAHATDGTCVFTYNAATKTINKKCEGINESLKKNGPEEKALRAGTAKECVVKKEKKSKERYCK